MAAVVSDQVGAHSLVRYDIFLSCLAKYICPDPPRVSGISCVLGKRVFHPFDKSNSSSDGLYSGTDPLTNADKELLQRLLAQHGDSLPDLEPEMSNIEIDKFLQAFRAISDRPMDWEPRIRSAEDRIDVVRRRLDAYAKHNARLTKEVARGKVRIFDIDRVPQDAPHPQVYSFLTREDAQAYLDSVSLSLHVVLAEDVAGGSVPDRLEPKCKVDSSEIDAKQAVGQPANDRDRQSASSLLGAKAKESFQSGAPAEIDDRTPQSGSGVVDGEAGRRVGRWPEQDRKLAVFFYREGRHEEGAKRLGLTLKMFKQYAKRWKEREDLEAQTPQGPRALEFSAFGRAGGKSFG